ncbi:MAG TPA: hypothetical protein VGZ22_19955 [Isosphaeraceae bacterium]|jgi:hypothetical protein|nr:hypothetical protein [Isosphaeraceae bacterium]
MSRAYNFALAAALAGMAVLVLTDSAVALQAVPLVDPAELTKHPEWVGREVAVDARVRFFRKNEQGEQSAELVLKRGNVLFRLPPRLRPERNGEIHVVRAQGILRKEDNVWFCDVNALTPLPRDLDRLEQAVSALPETDFERRSAWARWAARRGEDYKDDDLQARGRALEVEAIRIEADHTEALDRPALWLRLAQRVREHKLPAVEAEALAHRAFQARLRQVKAAPDLEALRREVDTAFPAAQTPIRTDTLTSTWLKRYAADPAAAYRDAPEAVRVALNRRLLVDVVERSFALQKARKEEDAGSLVALAEQAKLQLPDRPEVGKQIEEQGLEAAARHPEALRESEMKAYAQAFEALGEPDRARVLRRGWLEHQRRALSATDAEGRVILARQYEVLMQDPETAVDLIKDALRIDPRYAEAEKAIKAKGYRKVNDEWVKTDRSSGGGGGEADAGDTGPGGSLRGLTRQQVKIKMGGKPDQIIRMATQGQVVEQWVYRLPNGTKYITFVRRPDMPQAAVERDHTLH